MARRLTIEALILALLLAAPLGADTPLARQAPEDAAAKSGACLVCHEGIEKMHAAPAVKLGCVDCHGGDADVAVPPGAVPADATFDHAAYDAAKKASHVAPRFPERWPTSANPERTYTLLLDESAEFVRF